MAPKKKKGKGKKSKKPKLTKAEKARAKLEKSFDDFVGNEAVYQSFLGRMRRWIVENGLIVEELFRKFDTNQDGSLSLDEFKAGLLDLNAPCNGIELHVLAKMLDKDNNEKIDYYEFSKGFSFAESSSSSEGPPLVITKEEIQTCPCCLLGLWKPYMDPKPKYLKILFKMATFDSLRNYPGHFLKTVHSHIYVYGLLEIIKQETDITTTKLRIFLDKSRDASVLLIPDKTLEDYGFEGKSRMEDAEEVLLYYDYATEFQDCPVLTCDYYFTSR